MPVSLSSDSVHVLEHCASRQVEDDSLPESIAHSLLGSCWRQVSFNPDSRLAPGSTNMHNEAIASLAF